VAASQATAAKVSAVSEAGVVAPVIAAAVVAAEAAVVAPAVMASTEAAAEVASAAAEVASAATPVAPPSQRNVRVSGNRNRRNERENGPLEHDSQPSRRT
jgi:hypothetical protein